MTDYELLKAYGHSPAKAAEIVLDAKRADFFSRGWVAVVRNALAPIEARQGGDVEQAPGEALEPDQAPKGPSQ